MPILFAAPRRPLCLHRVFCSRHRGARFSLKVLGSLWRIVDECVKSNTILALSSVCDDNGLGSLDQAVKEFIVLRFCRLCNESKK